MQKTILLLLLFEFSTGIWAADGRFGFLSGPVIDSLKQIAHQHGVSAQDDLQAIELTGQKEYFNGNYLRQAILLFSGGTRMAVRVRLNPQEALLGCDSIRVY